MFGVLEQVWTFLKYWYFRYALVTELYMVEKWERNVVHIFLLAMFGLFFYFNYRVLVPSASQILVRLS
ncbi:serine palmitoyltransferase small subunit A [Athalia rosae]|uniref:serine palmitoyltransferase small subunit A n=1 Tax=Athalia rosae TaxID=37344 RepID=UPI002033B7E4|nr:serine palmitoyltransferase small subunit A [Athalia rosae]